MLTTQNQFCKGVGRMLAAVHEKQKVNFLNICALHVILLGLNTKTVSYVGLWKLSAYVTNPT